MPFFLSPVLEDGAPTKIDERKKGAKSYSNLKLGTRPVVARVISRFLASEQPVQAAITGGKESTVCPLCEMLRASGELFAFPLARCFQKLIFFSPQLSSVKHLDMFQTAWNRMMNSLFKNRRGGGVLSLLFTQK